MKNQQLIREQLDATLVQYRPLINIGIPVKGWIRAIRNALGMTASQLANKLGVAQQAVARIEKDELSGSVTIKTMRRVAEGLDCVFVYGFVPHSSLQSTVREQAQKYATKKINYASQTMTLEKQELNIEENQKIILKLGEDLTNNPPANLWNEL